MDLKLNGKRALVTGSTAGIGAAIAAELAREGARVIVNGRAAAGVEKAVHALKAESTIRRTDRRLIARINTDISAAAPRSKRIQGLDEWIVIAINLAH